ncbi:MAG TPA: PorV/PorQ family protein [Candidatus Acidoferrales bacterium]|nr:PorV/PorQ family protein [Candidatus Acidoferrales bacterium]
MKTETRMKMNSNCRFDRREVRSIVQRHDETLNGFFVRSLVGITLLVSSIAFGQQKLAQSGLDFLNVSTDPRAEAMGEAVTSLDGNSTSMFYNTAGMARIENAVTLSLGQVDWIAGIKHFYGSVAFVPSHDEYGVFGLTVRSVNYGDLQETIIANNVEGYQDIGTFSPAAYSIGVGYAKALTDKFAVGGDVNYVVQDLGSSITNINSNGSYVTKEEKLNVVSFDFGMIYKTGYKSLAFGMDLRNFSRELKYEAESFDLPLIFNLGISMNLLDMWNIDDNSQSLVLAVDATHPRDYPEQVDVGAEYTFMGIISLRGGYMFNNDVYGVTAGVGLHEDIAGINLGIDYSWTPFTGGFSDVQRLSLVVAY